MKLSIYLFLSFLLFTSCSSSDNNSNDDNSKSDFDRSVILTHWADNIILPAYKNLLETNSHLKKSISDFIDNPNQNNLDMARAAHKKAYLAWQKSAFFEIGPAKNENLRLYFNTFPVDVDATKELALSKEYNLHLASNASRQGYPALDYFLNGFGSSDNEIINKFSTDADAEKYRDYIKLLSERLVEKTAAIKTAWENGYRERFIKNDGSSASSSVDLIANDFLLYYEKFFRNGKIRFPVGYISGTAKPENVESYYNPTLSKELFLTANEAMLNFFEGKNFDNNNKGESFKSYLKAMKRSDVNEDIINNFNAIKATANNIDDTFKSAVVNDRTSMLNLHDKVQKNVIPMKVDMMQALNISVAYFDGDGD